MKIRVSPAVQKTSKRFSNTGAVLPELSKITVCLSETVIRQDNSFRFKKISDIFIEGLI